MPAYLVLALFGALTTSYYLGQRALLVAKLRPKGRVSATVAGTTLASATFMTSVRGNIVPLALTLPGTGTVILAVYRAKPRLKPRYR